MTSLLLVAFLLAVEPGTVWTSKEVNAKLAAAKPDDHKITGAALGKFDGYALSVTKREATGIGELHEKVADVLVIESGECTLVTGGKLVAPKNQSATEIRGTGIEGGEKKHLSAGDIIRIPAKTPHQMLLDPGKSVVYAVVKVDEK
jgi:mannose-6-phosphate isomerase-like protein (cupin superfamily)